MTTARSRTAGHDGLPFGAIDIVASVATHRALSAEQIRVIHRPDTGPRRFRALLARIGQAGLLAHVSTGVGSPQRLWFATEAGVRVAVEVGALRRPPRIFEAREIVGPLRAHTFGVNEAAISFVKAAREEGDDFGPLAWRHEVGHPLSRPARRGRSVIADAVLTYVRTARGKVYVDHRFLELDRATLAVDGMAAELARYADLYRAEDAGGEPLWRRRYPTFPSAICVLDGAGRDVLVRRRDTALALLRAEPQLTRTPEVEIRVCLLEELVARGPFAPIFRSLRDPGHAVDWLGNREEEDES